jgi:hypothetical protein
MGDQLNNDRAPSTYRFARPGVVRGYLVAHTDTLVT